MKPYPQIIMKPYPQNPTTYVWRFVHSYDFERDDMVKFCQEVLGFTPYTLIFVSDLIWNSKGNQMYQRYIATTFTLRTEEDALALKIVFAEYERNL